MNSLTVFSTPCLSKDSWISIFIINVFLKIFFLHILCENQSESLFDEVMTYSSQQNDSKLLNVQHISYINVKDTEKRQRFSL